MERQKIKIGVLLIGSLYWKDKCHRRKWRNNHLCMAKKQHVKVPIRYGRCSISWGNSYTMVFSIKLCDEQLGRAYIVPCEQDINTGEELIEEAECMWTAETSKGKTKNRISGTWGCVALLENPKHPIPDDLRGCWTKRVSYEPDYGEKIISAYGEEVVVNRRGFLKIPWPKTVDGSDLNFDALLATVTCPTLDNGCYPSAQDVAKANRSGKGREYFCNNRKHGIETFQDTEIVDCLAKLDDKRARIKDSYTNTGE